MGRKGKKAVGKEIYAGGKTIVWQQSTAQLIAEKKIWTKARQKMGNIGGRKSLTAISPESR